MSHSRFLFSLIIIAGLGPLDRNHRDVYGWDGWWCFVLVLAAGVALYAFARRRLPTWKGPSNDTLSWQAFTSTILGIVLGAVVVRYVLPIAMHDAAFWKDIARSSEQPNG